MFCIESLHIRKFKQIEHVHLENLPPKQWIFLTGENGYGKTLLLQAIATALHPIDNRINEIVQQSEIGLTSLVRLNQGDTFGVYTKKDNRIEFERQSNFIFLACYGSSRLATSTTEFNLEKKITYPDLDRLFNDQSTFRNIEFELIKWQLKAESNRIEKEEKRYYETLIDWTKKIFTDLLNLKDLIIQPLEEKIIYREKNKLDDTTNDVERSFLGSGHKSLIAFVGDLIIRLVNSRQDFENPQKLLGIVLIDEIELHLHPKLQKELPFILSKYFPNVQFIASTHSPIPVLGVKSEVILLNIERDFNVGIKVRRLKKIEKDIKYLLPNSILSSDLFDFNDLDSNIEPDIEAIKTQDNYEEIERIEEAKKRLNNLQEDIFPENLFEDDGL